MSEFHSLQVPTDFAISLSFWLQPSCLHILSDPARDWGAQDPHLPVPRLRGGRRRGSC